MIKSVLRSVVITSVLVSGATFAAAPDNMYIKNNSFYSSDAYVHEVAGQPLPAGQMVLLPWATVKNLCHGKKPSMLQAADPCSFEVYATLDMSNPKQIDVGTITFYVSDGTVGHIAVTADAQAHNLTIKSAFPGEFELDELS